MILDWHVQAQDIANNWTDPNDRAVAYQAAAEGIKSVRNVADTDTVTGGEDDSDALVELVARAIYASHQFNKPWGHADTQRLWHGPTKNEARAVLRALGLIKPDPTPSDRFKSAHPEWELLDRSELVEKALAFSAGEVK